MDNPLALDLDHILEHTEGLWGELRGERIFITGGTGFFGCWLLESFAWANDRQNLGSQALVLSRSPEKFSSKAPHLFQHPSISFWHGDVRNFEFPPGRFPFLIHAATKASAKLNQEDPLLMLDTIVQGTRRTLDFAATCGTKKFLFTSSGAVYGRQPPEITHIQEDYLGAPKSQDKLSAYGEGKRFAELLCALYANQYIFEAKIARCFAFVGPYLPLDRHYAIGNFIRDGIEGGPVVIKGDGTPYRSYLYVADLLIWLWTILLRGQNSRPYNVGSEYGITISDVAYQVADCFTPTIQVQISKDVQTGKLPDRYVPNTQRAWCELQLNQYVEFREALHRTINWCLRKNI